VTPPATGVVLSGRYRLTERIATGGMGTIWAAEDEVLSRKVAVKVLNEGLTSEPRFTERFRREARAAAQLTHPNIAGTFDYGEDDGRPYIVLELIDGETLADRLSRVGKLAPEEAARIAASVAQALAYAHGTGIVHRDVKPANVMITERGEVKVMDFGIAASVVGASGLTATGAVMGTAKYLSPEQARGDKATPASDIYALGVVMYETLSGISPFERETAVATAMAHIREDPRPLREVAPEVPESLAGLVHRCLAKDPKDRPTDAAVFSSALLTTSADATTEPIPHASDATQGTAVLPALATPAPWTRRPLPWILVAALLAIGLLAFFIVSSAGGDLVAVPRFIGKTRVEAAAAAKLVGLEARFEGSTSGRVSDQRPLPGTRIARGKPVFLTLQPKAVPVIPTASPPPPTGPGEDHHGKGKGHEKHGKGGED
jgi:serine/threonine-protein kinase